ncbi:SusD/RagB family nutrient-binding outer membrane lipoprotein [Belliella kenyensis]|uniref:SusD/RagB family nutrient-binding outer membrane lipoprotein n=1 Tax=Belliella kenyensis TaxID=1472724 RepID=A0ABV8EGX9_9BACT|nr:SusD/RagB family nutrient-binding outer membrane lipoprotein [Belliella kenyensis]MCH7402308.1 SusD/RagB family nutrient-binding outer membrane lipoprotein [Belliella kenyensis]MDN3603499.1 SusD/RagB family nutrient-binding outer membrane lipoprotein [Belliella kenyensis]
MRNSKIHILILLACFGLGLFSCESFIDINADPNNPTDPQLALLLPATQLSIVGNFNTINRGASNVIQHRAAGSLNRWDQTGTTFQSTWLGYYTQAIPDLEQMIATGTEEGAWGYVGIAKLQKAFLYSTMVDVWGDLPYTEAAKVANPKFDSGEEIYNSLFALIDEAKADLNRSFAVVPSADLFYQGSRDKWIKFANSLKFKLYIQTRKVNPSASAQGINALLAENNMINSNSEDFTFLFGSSPAPETRHPWYTTAYSPSRDGYVSMVVHDRLREQDDPRLRYYIFRLNERAGLANSQVGEGYYGRYPGDGAASPADQQTRAIVGIYPCGGVYDNGMIPSLPNNDGLLNNIGATTGSTANSFRLVLFANGDGTGAGIQPLLTNVMMKFYRAEAALTLNTGEDAGALLTQAVAANMQAISALSPAFPISSSTINAFNTRLLAQYQAATSEQRLELVMMQKWIAMYGNGIESYNDYRRTGLPALVELISPLDDFPERFFFSETELTSNETVVEIREQLQRNQQITPVFWRR